MKALSIKQPWAYLIAKGYKDIENRTRATNFRGRIYIHAGAKFDNESLEWLVKNRDLIPEETAWRIAWLIMIWKYGAIIGEVDIVDCVRNHISPWFTGPYGYVLENPIFYEDGIHPYKGRLGFFEVKFTKTKPSGTNTGDKPE